MRIASVLLVAALISTCAISGTFAKYVTEDSAYDSARVAKFGVTVLASGNLFGDSYEVGTANTPGLNGALIAAELSVVAASLGDGTDDATLDHAAVKGTDKVVAPGTKNDEGIKIALAGTPEVDNRIDITAHASITGSDVTLKAGKYGVAVLVELETVDAFDSFASNYDLYTYAGGVFTRVDVDEEYDESGEYYVIKDLNFSDATGSTRELTDNYSPVKFTLKKDGTAVDAAKEKTYAEIIDYFDGLALKNEANVPVANILPFDQITWEWKYVTDKDNKEIDHNDTGGDPDQELDIFWSDRDDTILGDLIALATADSDANLGYKVVKFDGGVDEIPTVIEVKTDYLDESGIRYYYAYAYTGEELEFSTAAEAIAEADVAVLTTVFGMNVRVTQLD